MQEITTTEPAINELAPSCLIKPNLNATRRVMNEISRLEKENFDESQLLPAAAAAAAEEAARKSSAASGFSNLTAVDDRVELTVPRKSLCPTAPI